jgi:protoporphyrinogen/coproporphyrinogen III oxidase
MPQSLNVAVIGAGISGLAAAYRLKQRGCQVTLFEASDTIGGNIRGSVDDNWLADSGYGLINVSDPIIQTLVGELELRDEVLNLSPLSRKRFVAYGSRLKRLPNTLSDAVWSGYLPFGTRMRLLFSRFAKKQVNDNDSISTVIERFLGPSAVSLVAEPLSSALFAGNPNDLNTRYAFPSLYKHLVEKRSLSRALRQALKDKRVKLEKPEYVGFRYGMPTLTNALADRLHEETVKGARIVQVKRHNDHWLLTMYIGTEARYFVCDKIIFATPAHALSDMLIGDNHDNDLTTIAEMPYAPLTVLNMGFRKADLAHKLDSAGFIVHKSESNSLLGVMFTSSILSERTPGGNHLVTAFVGGTENADFATEPVNKIKTAVLKDLNKYLGVKAYPVYVKSFSYPRAIPQFGQEYSETAEAITRFEQRYDGIRLVGQYRFGQGVESCIRGAFSTADSIIGTNQSTSV